MRVRHLHRIYIYVFTRFYVVDRPKDYSKSDSSWLSPPKIHIHAAEDISDTRKEQSPTTAPSIESCSNTDHNPRIPRPHPMLAILPLAI